MREVKWWEVDDHFIQSAQELMYHLAGGGSSSFNAESRDLGLLFPDPCQISSYAFGIPRRIQLSLDTQVSTISLQSGNLEICNGYKEKADQKQSCVACVEYGLPDGESSCETSA
jgi:hypothetical protein